MSVTNTLEGAVSMSIYTLLKGEHDEVGVLISLLEASPNALSGGRKAVFDRLKTELLSHAKAEEASVYIRLRERLPEKTEVDHAFEQHHKMEQDLIALEQALHTPKAWHRCIETLKHDVQHHVHEEEHIIFEQMKGRFSNEEADDMARNFHVIKQKELERSKSSD